MKDRFDIAADLRTIARLLEVKGENRFRTLAFTRGAGALESLQGDLDALVKGQRLKEIPGIGNALSLIIEEIYSTGECWMLQQLHQELPPGAIELSEVPGLSLRKIIALHDSLRIESVADLKAACKEGLVSNVKGFGRKSQAMLLASIAKLENRDENFLLLNHAVEQAEQILRHLRACSEVIEAEVAGTLRRRKETIRQICIVAASDQPRAVIERFLCFPALVHTDELEETRCRARIAGGLQAELIIARPDEYIVALHVRTGSPKHIAKLQELSLSRGVSFLVDRGASKPGIESESEIYQRLGLQYIPPELREDEGEIEAASIGTLPQPLTLENMRGMTHCHTVYSDGRNSIEEMALAAQAMGMSYLTIPIIRRPRTMHAVWGSIDCGRSGTISLGYRNA